MAGTQHRPAPLKRPGLAAYRRSWALVSCAAREQSLGHALARQLAVEGLNLILVDILADELESRAGELRAEFGIEVRTAAGTW